MFIPPISGTIEVLRRHNAILENLGNELNTGHHQEAMFEDRACIPDRNPRTSTNLPTGGLDQTRKTS